MALLRQCLRELRVKRGDWNVRADGWPQATSPATDYPPAFEASRHADRGGERTPAAPGPLAQGGGRDC
jgi:hypothetical protein